MTIDERIDYEREQARAHRPAVEATMARAMQALNHHLSADFAREFAREAVRRFIAGDDEGMAAMFRSAQAVRWYLERKEK